jgi:hypothetical protein
VWWWLIKFIGCALWVQRSNELRYIQRFVFIVLLNVDHRLQYSGNAH